MAGPSNRFDDRVVIVTGSIRGIGAGITERLVRERVESIHPFEWIGRLEDVAGAVAFLASDDAAFVTGAALLLNGGHGAVMDDEPMAACGFD